MADEVVMPRDMLRHRVAEERGERAAAAGGPQLGADEEEVGEGVLQEVLVAAAADMDLDGKAEVEQLAARGERVEPVCEELQLDLVKPIDEGD